MAELEVQAEDEHGCGGRIPDALERIATVAHYHFGQTIYFQDSHADCWYRIVIGAARECVLTPDGRRQVVDFLFPGDLFGFSSCDVRGLAGEIIMEPTILARYPRRRAELLAESDPQVARQVRKMAFEVIQRLQIRTVLLGRNNALEKVSAFLLEMAVRSAAPPGGGILLPMTRYDIADYLALAVETVSRTLTSLRKRGAIGLLNARCVQIKDHGLLFKLGAAIVPAMREYRSRAHVPHVLSHAVKDRPIDSRQRATAHIRHDAVSDDRPNWRSEP
jgi:CRP/FNR family transcriptional regulator, nitrogen fixation regulation protein